MLYNQIKEVVGMFGERLKIALQNKDISQLKLSKELGYTQQAINRWCNNITEPDNNTIVKIANYLGISTDYLLGNDDKLSEYETELKEIEVMRQLLIKNGFMQSDEDLTNEELDRLMKFVNANKDFLKGNK